MQRRHRMTNFIFENTWEENEEAVKTKKLAIIPVGSTEQHGPALPVGTDWMVARYLAEQIGKETDKGLVAPVIPYGHALYHADFTGTMAVSQTTLTAYVKEVCQQLVSYGFTHFLLSTGMEAITMPSMMLDSTCGFRTYRLLTCSGLKSQAA